MGDHVMRLDARTRSQLDRLYQGIIDDLDHPRPSRRPQSRVTPTSNEHKIHAAGTITT